MTRFESYVSNVENLIKDYTKNLPVVDLEEIDKSIEDSPAGCGKLWLEDFVDRVASDKNLHD